MNKLGRSLLACIILSIAAYGQSPSSGGGRSTVPPSPCGDASHALGWTGSAFNCQAVSGSAAAGGNASTLQWNNATALGGISQYTTNGTTTITGSATAVFDMSAAGPTTGLKLPTAGGASPIVDGVAAFNSTTHTPVWGFNGATTITVPLSKGAVGSQWLTSYNQATGAFGQTQPTFADLTGTLDLTSAIFGSRGTTTTVLHGNAAGVLSFGSIVNNDIAASTIDVTTKITGVVPVANGGTNTASTLAGLVRGGASYTAAELSGDATTSASNVVTVVKVNGNAAPSGAAAHQVYVGTAANTFSLKTIGDCTGGTNALSFAQSTDAFGCVANVVNGSLASTRIPFASGPATLTDSANLTYAAGSGISLIQGANNVDMIFGKRFTDSAPTGNFLHFQNAAANTDLFKVDASGAATATSFATSNPSGVAGSLSLIQGTTCVSTTNAWNFCAPGSVTTATLTMPASLSAGFWRTTVGGAVSFNELSGDATTSASAAVTVIKVNGVAYASGPSTDTVPIITAANTATYTGVTNCGDATHALAYSTGSHTFSCQAITGSAAAGAPTTSVQFNSGGAITGSANLTWVSPVLTIGAAGVTGQLSIAGLTSGATAFQASAVAGGTITAPNATGTMMLTNTGVVAAQMPALTGDATTSAGAVAVTLGATFKRRGISFTIGDPGNSSALTVAATTTSYVTVPYACTISAYNLAIDAGTITVKWWKVATGTAIPTSGNSINTSGVGISSGTAVHSSTVSDFTSTTVTKDDILAMNVTAVATAKVVNGVLQCDQ